MKNEFRPVWHFTPRRGWINDPNGLLFDGSAYHLYAQHNPNDIIWGPMHWLHAVSKDMIHWRETGIALAPDEWGTVFSGSAVTLADGKIAAMYTAHGKTEQQCLAFSDDGMHFERSPRNPVIRNASIPDFRDPKVFRWAGDDRWHVVISAGDRVHFYASPDLIDWEKTGEFGASENRYGDVFECPDLFPLRGADGAERWCLTASMIFRQPTARGRMQVFLGEFDGKTFRETDPSAPPMRMDTGYDCYAGASFYGTRERTFMAWLGGSSAPLPMKDFCGFLTLPRRLSLIETPLGHRVAQFPVLPPLHPADARKLPDAPLVIDVCREEPFSLTLLQGDDALEIGLNDEGEWFTRRAPGALFAPDAAYNADAFRLTREPRLAEGPASLRVVWDGPVVEIFADHGLYAHSLLFFSDAAERKIVSDVAYSVWTEDISG